MVIMYSETKEKIRRLWREGNEIWKIARLLNISEDEVFEVVVEYLRKQETERVARGN